MSVVDINIDTINRFLASGMLVKDIRAELGVNKKRFQKEIRELGYIYDQKKRQYVKADSYIPNYYSNTLVISKSQIASNTDNTSSTEVSDDLESSPNSFIDKSIDKSLDKYLNDILDMLNWFNKEVKCKTIKDITNINGIKGIEYDFSSTTVIPKINNSHKIAIDLDDKYKRTSILVNKSVYDEFNEFCLQHKEYNKKDLLSMALKEYMTKYR